jgi:hypothetical protein
MWHEWGREEMHAGLWWVKPKEPMGEKDIEENIWTNKGKWTVEN